MKILKATWENHPILGNFTLNLTKPDGTLYNTIVIAGENGTGKTTILKNLADFCDFKTVQGLKNVEALGPRGKSSIEYRMLGQATPAGVKIHYEDGSTEDMDSARETYNNKIGSYTNDPRNDGFAYSTAEAIYNVNRIDTIKASSLDMLNMKEGYKPLNPQQLKQLLIDIAFQDANDYQNKGEAQPSSANSFTDFEPSSRKYRFKKAFNDFFENTLKFENIISHNGEYDVVFSKYGHSISIGALSTGESQIVFRGGDLLRNSNQISNGVVFIDEPEISMHPTWQKKILSYYKGLFTTNGVQTAQLVIATHSEGVLESALRDPETLIIKLAHRPDGTIIQGEVDRPSVLNYTASAETNFQCFGTASTDYHNALYGYIEAEGWLNEYKGAYAATATNYIKLRKDGTTENQTIILSEKIRHQIHHPENPHNARFTEEELLQSINDMRSFIQSHP